METVGRQSNRPAAFETSAQVVGTSAGWTGRDSICGLLPVKRGNLFDDRAQHHRPVAAEVDHFVAQRPRAAIVPRAMLSTKVKSRLCVPSPNRTIGSPSAIRRMKRKTLMSGRPAGP